MGPAAIPIAFVGTVATAKVIDDRNERRREAERERDRLQREAQELEQRRIREEAEKKTRRGFKTVERRTRTEKEVRT